MVIGAGGTSGRGSGPSRTLSAAQARRIAVAAQQLDRPPSPGPRDRGHLRRVVQALGLLQIDSVNVLARAHLLTLHARLGDYPVELLDSLVWPKRAADRVLVETWAHEASMVPVELYPLLRWPRRHWSSTSAERYRTDHAALLTAVLEVVRDIGPATSGQIEAALGARKKSISGWWEWSETKRACEALFSLGEIGTAHRVGFERYYDLIERVLPAAVLAMEVPEPADAQRVLVERAARAHGVGTVGDLADYFRMGVAPTRLAVRDLVEDGVLLPVEVQGWRQPGYLHRDARVPRATAGAALLCPFDPLVWERDRTERIFDFHYRIEIYTPAARRIFGYYVLPLLVGDRIAGRLDLKADRSGGRLLVQAAWCEPGQDPVAAAAAAAAAGRLAVMAQWLGLAAVEVAPRGNLAADLDREVRVVTNG
ncbi:uncharacterized protein YcaQ [Nakamurella flavida]|nr:crosslink repair DNA glycosylase YcaQ family protein [Nakamurella flavida]MDP9776620.1 uncharacterized protein YcaQ [Nakamurella flavida]